LPPIVDCGCQQAKAIPLDLNKGENQGDQIGRIFAYSTIVFFG
jgi:hypothetical protein